MKILRETVSVSTEVKKSRFISYLFCCKNIDDLKSIRDRLRQENRDARHVVYAAVFGEKGEIYACSDDREPKNTAGRPCLDVLKGSGATDIALFVVRYFGGILLGTGGLAHAYLDSAKAVIEKAVFDELTEIKKTRMMTDYSTYNRLVSYIKNKKIKIEDEKLAENAEFTLRFESSAEEELSAFLQNLQITFL